MVKPIYNESGITIYCGDCRDVLPHLEPVDLVLTDPPYGMNFRSNHRYIKHENIFGDNELPIDIIKVLVKTPLNASYIFCRWDNLSQMPPPKSVLAWVKQNWSMGDLEHEHGRQWEAICFYQLPGHKFLKRIPDVIHNDRTGNNLHPTEKPLDLLMRLIDCNEGQTILDPFMGSDTTLVAAKSLGRKAIGIEIEKSYCDVAVKRLQQEYLPFTVEQKTKEQDNLLPL